ncbi:hypothetical protein GO730_15075 [Spirosoma sp. HMF3257]|uniref:Uncharacterized protein n=1 Tax=Spirosoma telluris TaxID=2183553 RepID=A0A327NLF5_9BACT|nr:hypothetical protein [Spirosoma telluris]RAI75179.1 hypothetical protein HMF3257_15020 [Spirosoma telluris]
MNSITPIHSSLLIETTNTCHQDHQHWQQIIRQQEEEIRQLRSLLLEIMNQYNCRSLRHDAVDYYRDLNHLQSKLDRLNRDMICEGVDCPADTHQPACTNTRFGLSATIERHATMLVSEFSRIKDGCLQFLSGMMSLNML